MSGRRHGGAWSPCTAGRCSPPLGQLLVGAPLVPVGLRSASFRIRHGLLLFPFQVLENVERAGASPRRRNRPPGSVHSHTGQTPRQPSSRRPSSGAPGPPAPTGCRSSRPRAVIIPDIEVVLAQFDRCRAFRPPALRGQDRLERLPEPERDRVGTPVAKAFPPHFERSSTQTSHLDVRSSSASTAGAPATGRGPSLRVCGDRRLPRRRTRPVRPGNLGYPDVQAEFPRKVN